MDSTSLNNAARHGVFGSQRGFGTDVLQAAKGLSLQVIIGQTKIHSGECRIRESDTNGRSSYGFLVIVETFGCVEVYVRLRLQW